MKKIILLVFTVASFCLGAVAQTPQLLGVTSIGGTAGVGTIFKVNGDGTGFSVIHPMANGSSWCTLLHNGSGKLYGTTTSGGSSGGLGSIFSYTPANGAYNTLHSFDSLAGFYPRAGLTQATNGKLYGTTSNGGIHKAGVFYSYDPSGSAYVKIHEFDTTSGLFANSAVYQATNGKIYGTAPAGGLNNSGVIFRHDPVSGEFMVAHNFNFGTGVFPYGSLIEHAGMLYGMAFGGGTLGYGVIYSLDPVNNNYTVRHNFTGINGAAPWGHLTFGASNLLYGMTSQGGTNNQGVIFAFSPSNNFYIKLYDLNASVSGSKPWGSLKLASNGKFYGMTASGGANNLGTVFSFDASGSSLMKLQDLSFSTGAIPQADLIEYNGPTGIDDVMTNAGWRMYPNPAANFIQVSNITEPANKLLTVTNMLGEILITNTIQQAEQIIDLSMLDDGCYMVTVGNSSGQLLIKTNSTSR